VLDMLRPITDVTNESFSTQSIETRPGIQGKTLYVRLGSEVSPEYERLKLVHMMFPGTERLVIHFDDTKKNIGAKCVIHDAFVRELKDMLSDKNVVIK